MFEDAYSDYCTAVGAIATAWQWDLLHVPIGFPRWIHFRNALQATGSWATDPSDMEPSPAEQGTFCHLFTPAPSIQVTLLLYTLHTTTRAPVSQAVQQNGLALQFAHTTLRADAEAAQGGMGWSPPSQSTQIPTGHPRRSPAADRENARV